MHRHQGGTFIFILGGKGYSTVNGVRHDWEAGDLAILPMVPGGVAHQHFNFEPGVPALWMRVGYTPNKRLVIANWIEQSRSTRIGKIRTNYRIGKWLR